MVELPPKDEAKEGEEKEKGEEKDEPMDTEGQAPKSAGRRFRKLDVATEAVVFGLLSRQQLKEAAELEASMAFEDQLIKETADKRNELESYIYAMRTKLDGPLKSFCSPADVSIFKKAMDDAEEWLYGDGYETTKNNYAKRLDDLLAFGKPIESRVWEEQNRPQVIYIYIYIYIHICIFY